MRPTPHLSPKSRKRIPPYVKIDSPALPLGHGDIVKAVHYSSNPFPIPNFLANLLSLTTRVFFPV